MSVSSSYFHVPTESEFGMLLNDSDRLQQLARVDATEQVDRDIQLMLQVEAVLVPKLGAWESNTQKWWHNLDYHGDGVRQIVFRSDVFPWEEVSRLQTLLCGSHELFCVLCELHQDLDPESYEVVGRVAILRERVIVWSRFPGAPGFHG